jgi:hypothetical protein
VSVKQFLHHPFAPNLKIRAKPEQKDRNAAANDDSGQFLLWRQDPAASMSNAILLKRAGRTPMKR